MSENSYHYVPPAQPNDSAIREVEVDAYALHLFFDGKDWAVWLDTEVSEHDGLCIGVGKTIASATAAAKSTLELCARRCEHLL